jgi:hypothetical protein
MATGSSPLLPGGDERPQGREGMKRTLELRIQALAKEKEAALARGMSPGPPTYVLDTNCHCQPHVAPLAIGS